jgi:hypothetical protein
MEEKIANFKKQGIENDKKLVEIQKIENNLGKLTEINKFKDQ